MKLLTKMLALQEEHGALTDDMLRRMARDEGVPLYRLESLRGFYPVFRKEAGAPKRVHVCRDIVCMMKGGADYCQQVRQALDGDPDAEVEEVSCLGRCDEAPAVAINEVPVSGEPATIAAYARGQQPLPADEPTLEPHHWPVDPYERPADRYGVLRRLLQSEDGDAARDQVIQTLKDSGLRGMGGAGFPTGMKWDFTRKAPDTPKYVVCNADESEPGTFKDRVIMEQLPHLMIEAMIIGGWLCNAREGIIYIRHEYQRERKAVERALEEARQLGALGGSVFGSGFDFQLKVFVSPGGYIMGEETALLEALEDKRGEPRNKPPFTATVGLWGKPTLMNNVETFADIPIILERGAQWWSDQGRGEYQGLKFMAVSGDVAQPDVYCVPMGTTVRELLERAGGIGNGKRLYAFSPGGASTNFLPADRQDTPLDFKALQDAGSALGSGAMVFVAEGRDVVELAVSEVRFFRNESCGKCVPCRVGSHKAVEMVEAAMQGRPQEELDRVLRELNTTLAQTSICGLGQVALAPLISIMDNFPDDAARRLRGEPAEKT